MATQDDAPLANSAAQAQAPLPNSAHAHAAPGHLTSTPQAQPAVPHAHALASASISSLPSNQTPIAAPHNGAAQAPQPAMLGLDPPAGGLNGAGVQVVATPFNRSHVLKAAKVTPDSIITRKNCRASRDEVDGQQHFKGFPASQGVEGLSLTGAAIVRGRMVGKGKVTVEAMHTALLAGK